MSSLTPKERELKMCRSIFAGRDVSKKWAAECCGISVEEFEKQYEQYIWSMCQAIHQGREWAVLKEYRTLIQEGYMRAGEFVKRFRMEMDDAEDFLGKIASEETRTIGELIWFIRMNEYIALVNAGYLTDAQCLDIIKMPRGDFERWMDAWKITKKRLDEEAQNGQD